MAPPSRIISTVKYVCDQLAQNDPTLGSVRFNHTLIGDEGVELLARHISKNTHVKKLLLAGCAIHDQGAIALAEGLARNESVQVLHLKVNKIGPIGAEALGKLFRTNNTILQFDVTHNPLSHQGVEKLLQGLEYNTTLESLGIMYTPIGLPGCRAVAKMLKTNQSLKILLLSGSVLLPQEKKVLVDGIEHNFSLERVYMGKKDVYEREATFYTEMNEKGRRTLLKKENEMSIGLWSHILAKVSQDEVFYFLKSKPTICKLQ